MNQVTNTPPNATPPRLLAAVAKLLRPLVRLLVAYQITYPQLVTLLKGLYVEVAEQDFQVAGKRQSDSRINLLTGIHRKDVRRLREIPVDQVEAPYAVSAGARLIAHWQGEAEYLDPLGKPRPLTVKASAGQRPELEQLVERVCRGDIRPRVILDEWLRLGIARVEDDRVILNTGAFTPDTGFDEKAYFFGKTLQDHIAAGSHNLLGEKPPFFDRSVYYDGLTPASLERLSALAEELGMQALGAMNREALALQNRDRGESEANFRMNFGVFNYNARLTSKARVDAPSDSSHSAAAEQQAES